MIAMYVVHHMTNHQEDQRVIQEHVVHHPLLHIEMVRHVLKHVEAEQKTD